MPDMVQECIVLMQHDAWRKQDVQNERPWKSHDTQKFYKLDWIHCHVIAAFRLVKKFFNYLCYWEKWHIGIVNDDIRTILSDMKINNVRWLPEIQKHQFVADPFAVHHEGNVYIFAEFWDATSPVGRIVFTDETRGYGKWEEVFNSTTHLSYPYLLMDGDTYYCMPESSESGDLVLYKSTEFPRVWAKEKMIFESSNIVDASIVLYNDTYWLFAARDRGDSSFELDVWFADCLAGKWFPHPQNPVKRDITSARPAGTPFIVDNVLYRPGQECSLSYGSGIAINRITLLSGTEYAEERVGIICGPDNSPYPDGMHTLSVVGGMVVIDAKKKVFTLFNHRVIAYKSKRIIRSL
jgi:hypothetical protein